MNPSLMQHAVSAAVHTDRLRRARKGRRTRSTTSMPARPRILAQPAYCVPVVRETPRPAGTVSGTSAW